MKMVGVVAKYNNNEKFGYIKAGDDNLYLFYPENILNFSNIKEGNMVKFKPIFIPDNIATEIEIIDNILKK